MESKHRKYDPKFKLQVVLDMLSNKMTFSEMTAKYQLHPSVINRWKKEFLENAHKVFEENPHNKDKEKNELIESLYKTIGKRDIELEWMKKKVGYFA